MRALTAILLATTLFGRAHAAEPYATLMQRMSDVHPSPSQGSALIVRIDEGVICMACYGKQLDESASIAKRLPVAFRKDVIFVRLIVVRRPKDVAGRLRSIPERTSVMVSDVGGEIAAACRVVDPYGDLFVLYPDGKITAAREVVEGR